MKERGAASIVMLAALAFAVVAGTAAARAGSAAVASARADAAADAAALAGADMLALGRGAGAAVVAARQTAEANGARLLRCECDGPLVTVQVRVRVAGLADARATARAEVTGRTFRRLSALHDSVVAEVGEELLRAGPDHQVRA